MDIVLRSQKTRRGQLRSDSGGCGGEDDHIHMAGTGAAGMRRGRGWSCRKQLCQRFSDGGRVNATDLI